MRCSVARLCERTVGRRVPPLGAGGGLLHTTPHCVVVTASGAEPWSFATRTEPRLVQTGAELRRYGKPHCSLRQGRERAELVGGWQRHGVASFAKRWSWLPRRCRTITSRSCHCAIWRDSEPRHPH